MTLKFRLSEVNLLRVPFQILQRGLMVWLILIGCLSVIANPSSALSLSETGFIGGFGSGDGQFKKPGGLAAVGNSILVVDRGNRRIQKFASTGVWESSFQTIKDDTGKSTLMDAPGDIAVDQRGAIYVSDAESATVYQFDTYGQFVKTLGGLGVFGVKFNDPRGLAIDVGGYLYIADYGNNRVLKINSSGNRALTLSGSFDQLARPIAIVVSDTGNILILDTSGVTQFDELGKYQHRLISIEGATSLATDVKSQIYLGFADSGLIQVYSPEGRLILEFKTDYSPVDLLINNAQLWVTDKTRNGIRIYDIR